MADHDDEDAREEKRHAQLARLIFQNIGGFLAVGAVLWSGGSLMQEVKTIATVQAQQTADLHTVRISVTRMESKVEQHDREIERLERDNARRVK